MLKPDSGDVGVASRCLLSDCVARAAASTASDSTEVGARGAARSEAGGEKGGASVATGPLSDSMSLGLDPRGRN